MSGIAGFISTEDSLKDRSATLRRMAEAMSDRTGLPPRVIELAGCTLAERTRPEAAIVKAGQTPDGRMHAVVTGDVLNLAELRHELHAQGMEASSYSCASVIAFGYSAWGGGLLRRLRGAFALAIWDNETGNLFIARDPLGQRTLFYVQHQGRFLFSSELRSLASSAAFPISIDTEAVSDCLTYGSPVAPRTMYTGVRALRPGECVFYQSGEVSHRTYWTLRDVTPTNLADSKRHPDFLPEFRTRLAEVVRLHFSTDARLGCVLTGDIGSTLVTGLAAKVSPTPLRTFSVCYADEDYRSDDYAPRVARHFGTRHESRLLGATDVARDLDSILAAQDQPTDDGVTSFYHAQAASTAGLTALLSGTGADALLGRGGSLPTSPSTAGWLRRFAGFSGEKRPMGQILASLLRRGGSLHEVAALQQRLISETVRQRLLAFPGVFRPHDELEHLPREVPDREPILVNAAWMLRARLAGVEIPTLQRSAAVFGVRHLFPLLDPTLLAWCRAHPWDASRASLDEAGGVTSTLNDLLLPDTRIRPQAGDTPPFHLWMRGTLRPFMEQTFSDASLARSGYFQTGSMRRMWEEAIAGGPADWRQLWRLAVLVNFVNRRVRTPAFVTA
ncbi:MAG: asparagine synthase-related protein [Opitutaceae bacterium]|nr:asparagine synthase-related protein [Opitutaceae bacterium]